MDRSTEEQLRQKIEELESLVDDLRHKQGKNDDRFAVLVEQIEHPCFIVSPDMKVSFCNDKASDIFKTRCNQIAGKFISEIFPEDCKIVNHIKHCILSRQPVYQQLSNELPGISGDRLRIRILPFEDSALLIIKYRIEDHIGIQALLKDLPDIIFLMDKRGNYLDYFVNDPTKLAVAPDKFIGKNIADISLPDELKKKTTIMINEVLDSGQSGSFEYELETITGKRWFEGRMSRASKDEVFYFARDITEKKESEILINRQQHHLSALLNSSPVIIWTIDADGTFTLSEGQGLAKLGLRPGQVVGMAYHDFFTADPDILKIIEQGLNGTGGEFYVDFQGLVFELRCFPQTDAQGNVVELLGIAFEITELEKTVKALRESEEKFRTIFNNAPIGIFRSLPEGKFIEVNPALATMLGYQSPEEVITSITNIAEEIYVKPEKRSEIVEQVIEEHRTIQYENRYRRKDGSVFTANLYLNKIKDEQGKVLYLEGIVEDITERKQAEEKIRESERRFRTLFENVKSIAVQGYQPDGTVHYWNKGSEELYGYSAEEAIGKNLLDLIIAPAMRNETAKAIAKMFVTGVSHAAEELLLQHKKGYLVPVFSNHTILDLPGRGKEMFCIDIDLSELKEAEAALKQSEKKYRLLVEHQTDLVVRVDAEGKFTFVSPSYCKLFGMKEEELLGQSFYPLIHKDDQEHTRREMLKLLAPPYHCYLEQRAKTKDGWRWIGWSDTAVVNSEGEVESIIGVGRDITERKKAEAALRESEQRYRTLVEQNPSAIYILDGLNCIYTNSAGLALLGYIREEELLNASIVDHIAPENKAQLLQFAMPEKAASYENLSILRFIRKDGNSVFVEANSFPIMYGEEPATMMLVQNITERIAMEKELRESERRLKEAQQAGKFAHWDYNVDSGIITFSDSAYSILDIERDVKFITRRQAVQLFAKTDQEKLENTLDYVIRSKKPVEVIAQRKDSGSVSHIFIRCHPVLNTNGEVMVIKGIMQDITQTKIIEQELREHRAALARANELALLGTYHINFQSGVIYWSDELKKIVPLDHPVISISSLLEIVHPDDRNHFTNTFNPDNKMPNNYQSEFRFHHKNGRVQFVIDRGEILRNEKGEAVEAFGTIQDITELKLIENELREANAAKDKFFTIIAHDLRSPFTGLLGTTDYLSKKAGSVDPKHIKRFADRMYRETANLYKLIENLLTWSRLQTGRISVNKEVFSLSELLAEVSELLKAQFTHKQISLVNECTEKIMLNADKFMVETIIRNLLSNAIKFTPVGGLIETGITKKDSTISLFVKDNGVGIEEKRIAYLFEIGHQKSTSGTEKEKGTGLGLILCRDFAEINNGTITVESRPGEGSTFYLNFPKS